MTESQRTGTAEEVLTGVSLLADLPETKLRALAARCRWHRARPNDHIIDHDSHTKDVFFVIRGRVRIVVYSLSGQKISFEDIGPGSHFGELAAIDGQPRSASVVALDEVLLASLSPREFIDLVTSHRSATLALLSGLSSMLRQADKRIMDLSTLAANNRVYAELLRLASADARPDGTAEIRPIPLHGDIASRVSTTRETVNRVLSALAKSGLVGRKRETLVILDMMRLAEMVEEFKGE